MIVEKSALRFLSKLETAGTAAASDLFQKCCYMRSREISRMRHSNSWIGPDRKRVNRGKIVVPRWHTNSVNFL